MHHQNGGELAEHGEPAQPHQRIQPHVARTLVSSWQTEHRSRPDIRLNVAAGAAHIQKALCRYERPPDGLAPVDQLRENKVDNATQGERSQGKAIQGVTAMAYELDQFISDCRSILARDPGPAGPRGGARASRKLLQNPDFVRKHCEEAPRGLHVLYEDPKLGFQILAHINDKARVSPPHDHGESWAIYGQATHYTEMTEWEREDDGGDPSMPSSSR